VTRGKGDDIDVRCTNISPKFLSVPPFVGRDIC